MEELDINRQYRFEQVYKLAAEIREKLKGGMYYGIPIADYPNQADVQLAIAYNLQIMEELSVKMEVDIEKRETV